MYHRFSSCSWSETWGQRKNCRRCSTPGPCIFIFYCKHASIHSWYIGRQNKALRIIWKRIMVIGCMVTCSWCSSGTPCPSAARRRWWGPWGGRSSPPPPSGSRRPGTPWCLCWSARRGSGGAGWRRRRRRPQQQQPRGRGAGAEGTTTPWPRRSKGGEEGRRWEGDGVKTHVGPLLPRTLFLPSSSPSIFAPGAGGAESCAPKVADERLCSLCFQDYY